MANSNKSSEKGSFGNPPKERLNIIYQGPEIKGEMPHASHLPPPPIPKKDK